MLKHSIQGNKKGNVDKSSSGVIIVKENVDNLRGTEREKAIKKDIWDY